MSQSGKSKLPDFKEVTGMASKLFTDVKTSIGEIIKEYKANRHEHDTNPSTDTDKKPSSTEHSQTPEQPSAPPSSNESSSSPSSSETTNDDSSKPE